MVRLLEEILFWGAVLGAVGGSLAAAGVDISTYLPGAPQ